MSDEAIEKVSIIISKGSLDGIYPGLIMANGARAEGIEANLFFTFFGLDAIHKKRHEHIKVATVGNPGLHIATWLGGFPGMSSVLTHVMEKQIEELDIPSIPEFVEMIADTGAGMYACKASVDLFKMEKSDFIDQVDDIITVGEFYEKRRRRPDHLHLTATPCPGVSSRTVARETAAMATPSSGRPAHDRPHPGGRRGRRRRAGLTAARRLRDTHDVVVIDKGRGVGGRMATRRIGDATFDHGAQFVTTHHERRSRPEVRRWCDVGVATALVPRPGRPAGGGAQDGHVRYRGTVSMNAVAKHLADGLDVRRATRAAAVGSRDGRWSVQLDDRAAGRGPADDRLTASRPTRVVLTAPVPQSLELLAAGAWRWRREDARCDGRHRLPPVPGRDGPARRARRACRRRCGRTRPRTDRLDRRQRGQGHLDRRRHHDPRRRRVQRRPAGTQPDERDRRRCSLGEARSRRRPGRCAGRSGSVQRWRYARPGRRRTPTRASWPAGCRRWCCAAMRSVRRRSRGVESGRAGSSVAQRARRLIHGAGRSGAG